MEYILAVLLVFAGGYLMGAGAALRGKNTLKRENERLNSELHKLTDRDSKGRFKGGKK